LHISVVTDDMDLVFKALADAGRRRLLDCLHATPGQTLGALTQGQQMTRQAVSQHLALLEAANLVTTVRRGREKLHYLNPVPIHAVQARWIAKFERPPLDALAELKAKLEGDDDG
jgi:DNA-binding transcriptional ArsR family regulator